jgi:hypothetical protein
VHKIDAKAVRKTTDEVLSQGEHGFAAVPLYDATQDRLDFTNFRLAALDRNKNPKDDLEMLWKAILVGT